MRLCYHWLVGGFTLGSFASAILLNAGFLTLEASGEMRDFTEVGGAPR
jgi:hypothetical protein